MTRPIEADISRPNISRSGKKAKVQTLDKDGQRLRYFADDDRYVRCFNAKMHWQGLRKDSNSGGAKC